MTHRQPYTRRLVLLAALLMLVGLLPGAPLAHAQSGGSISYGTRLFGEITADAPRLTYSFPGSPGDVIEITVDNWTGTLDLRADLIAPNGEVIGSSAQNSRDDNAMGAYLSAILPDDGIYLLRISSANATTGEFALMLDGRGPGTSTPLAFGEPFDVELIPGAERQQFVFEAEDCPTILMITDLGPGRPHSYPFVARVTDQRGQTVALLRGGEEMEGWITVTPGSGRYAVDVSSADQEVAGSVRLLVTCGGAGVMACETGVAAILGIVGTEPLVCEPCFTPGDPLDNGGCSNLDFRAEQDGTDPFDITVTWNPVSGATGYAVYVYGRTPDSGEVYLTHAVWNPGDPMSFSWLLPAHYVEFRFVLRVYAGDDVICTADTGMSFEERPPDQTLDVCLLFGVGVTANTGTTATVTWPTYPGAEGFSVQVANAEGDVLPGWPIIVPASQLSMLLELPPGDYTVVVSPWTEADGAFCGQEVPLALGQTVPCEIRTNQHDVPMRIGPGVSYAIFAYMPADTDLRVLSQVQDSGGTRWWQLDTTQISGGGGVAAGLWVAQDQVEADPICGQVPTGHFAPPLQPQPPQQAQPPEQPTGPGQWLPCGSCDTCAHPAQECVTSPEGECLWDPGFCVITAPSEPEQDEDEDQPRCVFVTPAVNPAGAGTVQLSSGNCVSEAPGNYRPGSTVRATYQAFNCQFTGWSGCAGGTGNPVNFTVNSSCTITANFTCP